MFSDIGPQAGDENYCIKLRTHQVAVRGSTCLSVSFSMIALSINLFGLLLGASESIGETSATMLNRIFEVCLCVRRVSGETCSYYICVPLPAVFRFLHFVVVVVWEPKLISSPPFHAITHRERSMSMSMFCFSHCLCVCLFLI